MRAAGRHPQRAVLCLAHWGYRVVDVVCCTVAVVSGDEPGDLNVVRIFSLGDNDYVDKMRFHGDVHAVLCNRHCIIVCLKNQLILHSMHDMTVLQTLSTFPSPTPQGVVALGARWVAYASNQPLRSAPDDESNTDPSNTYGSAYLDIGVAAASTAASGAMQLGGLGLRTLNSYLGSSPPIAQPPDQPAQYAGTVMVRDLHNHTVVHHFKAHEGAVSIIRFDPSGLLLATAGVDGHNINVFQVNASHDNGKNKSRVPRPPKHLYKLVRGMTSAIIDDLSFSPDTRWISVTTRSRTAHLYAINADGSYASVETHVPSPSIDSAWPLYPMSASYAASTNTPLTLFAVQRIKQREHLPPSVMSRTLSANPTPSAMGALASSCTRFAIPGNTTSFSQFPAAASGIFMVTGEGVGVVLANYRLTPECKEDPDTLAHTILLDADCQGTMDMCRRRSWREQECNAQRLSSWTKAAQANVKNDKEEQGGMPEWVSNVEIYTHPRGEDAVWGSKHFRFKAFCRGAQGLGPPATGPPGLIEQLQTADVGGACGEMDGAHDPDSEDYFFVQGPGPRTRPAVSPHSWPMCATASPDVLHLNMSHSSPGVYGGLPSSLGSSQGTPPLHESRVHAQGREPSGAASYAANYGNSASAGPGGYAYRNDAANRGTLSNAKTSQSATHGLSSHDLPEEEGLFEMDPPTPPVQDKRGWDSDADSDADVHSLSRNSLLPAAPTQIAEAGCGPADTTMTCVFDDDEFGDNDDFFSHKAVANASARGAPSAARRSNPIQPLNKPMQSLATSLPDSKALAKAQSAAGCEGLDHRAGAPDSLSGECGHSDTLSHESCQLLHGHASPPKARAHEKGSGRSCHASKDSMKGSEKDSMYPASQDSMEAGGPAWHSDNAYDQYDGDGSSKGDNETPVGSMSPSTAVQALENIKKLNLKLHQDWSPEGAHALSSPDDWWFVAVCVICCCMCGLLLYVWFVAVCVICCCMCGFHQRLVRLD